MIAAQLESLIVAFESRLAAAKTRSEVSVLLQEFRRATGLTERADPQVRMINGAVVPPEVWSKVGGKFAAFQASLERKAAELAREERATTARACVGTFEVLFAARVNNFETDEEVKDRSVLALAHGARDETHLEDSLDLSGLPVARLPVPATVIFDPARETLHVVIAFAVERELTEREVQITCERLSAALDHGWGTNYHFEVVNLDDDLAVHFDSTPVGHRFVASS